MHPTGRHMVLLLVFAALVVVRPYDVGPTVWHIHVVNGLSNATLFVHCKSKDNDIGQHYLDRGAQIQWSFAENIWKTTLFWCFLRKPGATVSFDVFWHENDHMWLAYRCTNEGTCFWIAKDGGIYLRNIPDNVDELIHNWPSQAKLS